MEKTSRNLLILFALLLPLGTQAQFKFRLGQTFDANGVLVKPDTVFRLTSTSVLLAGKLIAPAALRSDTYFVFIKTGKTVVGRFYAKRNASKLEANCFIKITKPGVYRALVYNPKDWTRLIVKKRFYITSDAFPTAASLLKQEYNTMAQAGTLKSSQKPAATTSPTPTSPASTSPTADEEVDLGIADSDTPDGPTQTDIDAAIDQGVDAEISEARMLEEIPEDLSVKDSEFQGAFTNSDTLEREANVDLDRF
jgi:hypothetical protein